MTTLGLTLTDAKQRLASVSSSSSLDAQLLLAEVLDVSRAHVIAHPEKVLTPEQAATYESLIARREKGEPVAYILGQRAFYDREFLVTPAVLIPRPETELLLEEALHFAQNNFDAGGAQSAAPLQVVDVGTGSGALAVTFAAHISQAQVYATDISQEALFVAQKNAALQNVKITFFQGDLLLPLIERGIKVDIVMANLPYIASDEVPTLEVSQFEPITALDGGGDGLDLVRNLLAQIPSVANPNALILLEIGARQGTVALEAVNAALAANKAVVIPDYAGHDRIVRVEL